jgi:uncharacterized Rmd1/YagE family protein
VSTSKNPLSPENLSSAATATLKKSRTVKKKPVDQQEQPNKFLEVIAYSAADQFNLSQIRQEFEEGRGLFKFERLPDVDDAITFSSKIPANGKTSRFFVFEHGSVVFWNLPEDSRIDILKHLVKDAPGKHPVISIKDLESESMDYIIDHSVSKSTINKRGEVTLCSNEKSKQGSNGPSKASLPLEQYSVSHAMALSVKLANWEASLDTFADSVQFVAESLSSGRQLTLKKTEVFQKTGQLFQLRHNINLGSNMLDTPDFYWDREDLELLFTNTCNSLSLGKRARLMNDKLSYCYELMQLLISNLDQEHNSKLEWIIIILIAVEILFEIVHFIDKFYT